MKVVTIVGTRPELIKLSRVIALLDVHTNHVLIHTGQNYDYELNEVFFKDLGIRKPDYFLNAARDTSAATIASVIEESDKVLREEAPDALLLYGDTNSCLSVISAKRLRVPIFHMEAGNRCFDQRVPEEINRKIVDHLSDINLPLSEHARNYLINEGIPPETVIKTGSPMKEVLKFYSKGIEESSVLESEGLQPKEYFLVSTHREENVDSEKNFQDLLESLDALVNVFGKKVIVSTHPRTRKKLETLDRLANDGVSFMKPFGFNDYIKLQQNAFCVISDSGTITEESSILGFPAITIRQAHERPEGMDVGTLIMAGLQKERIIESVKIVTSRNSPPNIVHDYNTTDVSNKVLNIIMSYTDYVNRTVWEKRVLIIGSTGMLGHQLLRRLEKQKELEVFDFVFRTKRRKESIKCDVTDYYHLQEEIERLQPQVIVNCVGILVGGSHKSKINAIAVNSLLPHHLQSISDEIGAKLIHISTDCVFSGNTGSYTESSLRDADDVYGRTKALGEIISDQHLTIRTSIVGPELKINGEGLLHWFLTSPEKELNGFSKVFWGGVTTIELAKAIEFAIKEGVCGVWNLTNGEPISKFDMLTLFNHLLSLNNQKVIIPSDSKISNKSLKSERGDIGYIVPSYVNMFEKMGEDIFANKADYAHYNGLK